MSSAVSTWMGDRLGTPRAVGITFLKNIPPIPSMHLIIYLYYLYIYKTFGITYELTKFCIEGERDKHNIISETMG